MHMQPPSSTSPATSRALPSRPIPGSARVPLLVYRALFPLAFLAMLPSFIRRMLRRGNYRHKFGQRFGLYSRRAQTALSAGGWTWIHAVSVGEMVMAVQLARVLQQQQPGLRILLSTTTSTGFHLGREEVARMQPASVELIYFPLDFSLITRRVLKLVRPKQVILVDKEFWPNLITECYRRRIPLSIVNAMLSPRSEQRFLQWRRWSAPFFAMLDKVCVQQPEDVARWEALGVRREALECTGSLKFDFAASSPGINRNPFPRQLLKAWGLHNAPILLGGSTFSGEEEMLVEIWQRLREDFPALLLILVPRHAERRAEVIAMLQEKGVRFACRRGLCLKSSGDTQHSDPLVTIERVETPAGEAVDAPEVLLIDTTGELRDWYPQATLCYIGKSMSSAARGGQNPAEPILAGRPALFGPQMQNFAVLVRQFLAVDGATQVQNSQELEHSLRHLLSNSSIGEAQVSRAKAVLSAHEGANNRVASRLLELVVEKNVFRSK